MKKFQVLLILVCAAAAVGFLGWKYFQNQPIRDSFSAFFSTREPKAPVKELATRCGGKRTNDSQCWGDLFNMVLAKYGVEGAFDLLSYAYQKTNMVNENTCHDLTHAIGRTAYRLFVQGKQFSVSEKTAYCNYGFFHGVIEGMVALKKPLTDAKKFCLYMNEKLGKKAPELLLQCYHGIGHGAANNHDPRTWGNEMALLAPALSICDQISTNHEERWRCASGVFHGLGTFYRSGLYNLRVNMDNPFWVCPKQTRDEYKETCYRELSAVMGMVVPNGDFLEIAKKIDTIPEDQYAIATMTSWSVPYKESVSYRPIGVAFCQKVSDRLRIACIQSIARQMMQGGKPGNELADAIMFCSTEQMTDAERSGCNDFVFYWNSRWYPVEKAKATCDTVNMIYRPLCYENIQKNSVKQ